MTSLPGFRYWDRDEVLGFVIEHGLLIATGTDAEDECALTRRGLELWAYLDAARQMAAECGGMPL